ncbi:MAG: HAD family hydrolase [Alphaproteobacteria bacterium]
MSPRSPAPRPAAFFDRDGVLNHDVGYIHKPADFVWIDGAREAIRRLNALGALVFVVTNQAGIARGMYQEADVLALHGWVNKELAAEGAHVDAFYFCPHHPSAGNGPYSIACTCRKPAPGMLTRAAAEWPVDLGASFLIGDRDTDIAAAEAAGVRGFLFSGGNLNAFLSPILGTLPWAKTAR